RFVRANGTCPSRNSRGSFRKSTTRLGDSTMRSVPEIGERVKALGVQLDRVIIGQAKVKEQVMVCLLAGGHALLEGVPGTGKTLLGLAISRLVGCRFRRIQFTPDLM